MRIKACIFDLGGTIVDRYSITPHKSLIETFKHYNININNKLIFDDIGIDKCIHIGNILEINMFIEIGIINIKIIQIIVMY